MHLGEVIFMEDKKILNLLNENALEVLQKRGFTGKLTVEWRNGKVVDLDLINRIHMSIQKDLFPFNFFEFGDDDDS